MISSDEFNRSRNHTVLVAAMTGNLRLSEAPGNVYVGALESGLPRDSVVNVSRVVTMDRRFIGGRSGALGARTMVSVDNGLRMALAL